MNNRFVWAGVLGGLASVIVYFFTGDIPIMLSAGAAAFGVFSFMIKPKKESSPIDVIINEQKSFESILSEGESHLQTALDCAAKIENEVVQQRAYKICNNVFKILEELRTHPEKIPTVRKFLNYYLPTLTGILNKFERIENNDAVSEDIQNKVIEYLDHINDATEKLHANMFEDELLDMSIDMEIMTQSVKEEGLIEDENRIRLPSNEENIELTQSK